MSKALWPRKNLAHHRGTERQRNQDSGSIEIPRFARNDKLIRLKNLSKRKTARARLSTRAAGGTVGIDQEVVTLRGLFGNSGSQRDLNAGRITTLTHR